MTLNVAMKNVTTGTLIQVMDALIVIMKAFLSVGTVLLKVLKDVTMGIKLILTLVEMIVLYVRILLV